MLRFYDVVIFTGVDEFIFVDPELKLGLDGLDRYQPVLLSRADRV